METHGDQRRPLVAQRALAVAGDEAATGRAEDAAFLYRQVLGADPGDVDALYGLATLHHGNGEHREAQRLLEAALAARPHDDRVRSAIADVERATARSSGSATVVQRTLAQRVARRFVRPALSAAAQRPRVWKYRALSTCHRVSGSPLLLQPVLFVGAGEIVLGQGVQFGWRASPLFYTGYCHVEASNAESRIELGDRVEFNNNVMIKSEGAGIRVGRDGLFGAHVEVLDSDFHELDPARRRSGTPRMAPVDVGENVFVGMGVKILKGVTIGADAVIGAGAVVTSSIPAGVIAAGNPARVVREL